MKYDDICSVVSQRAHVGRVRADGAVKATLQALSEQADPPTLQQVLAQLPPEFAKTPVSQATERRPDPEVFLERVASLEGVPAPDARRDVFAVLAALTAAVPSDVLDAMVRSLGAEYQALLPPVEELLDAENFLDTVRWRAEADSVEQAEAMTRATLSSLAERITSGQARDLRPFVPERLRPYLEPVSDEARPFDHGGFLGSIADQRDTADQRARAVLATVREAAPESEIQQTLAQLPTELARLFT